MAQEGPRTSILTRAAQFFTYLLFRGVELVLAVTPLPLCALAGRAAGWLSSFVFRGHFKLAMRNIEIAFGREMDAKQRSRMARRHFTLLGGNLICSLKTSADE